MVFYSNGAIIIIRPLEAAAFRLVRLRNTTEPSPVPTIAKDGVYMKKSNLSIYIILFLLMVTQLSGCALFGAQSPESLSPSGTVPPTQTQGELSAKDKTIIVYARAMDETNATKLLIDEFNRRSSTIFVKYQELPADSDSIYNQLKDKLSAHSNEYDIIDFDMSLCAEFASLGYISDISPYIKVDAVKTEDFFNGAYESVKFDGGVWGLPRNISTGILFYRKDIVGKAPKTWDNLINFCTMLSYDPSQYGFSMGGKQSEILSIEGYEFINAYGGKFFSSGDVCIINSKESAEGLTKLYELYHSSYAAPKLSEKSNIDSFVDYTNGSTVFMRNQTSVFTTATDQTSEVLLKMTDIAPVPKGIAGGGSFVSGNMAAISNYSDHKNEAWEFLKFLTSYDGQKIITLNSGRFPVLRELVMDTEIRAKYPRFKTEGFCDAMEQAVPRPATSRYRDFTIIFQEELAAFLENDQDVSVTLNNVQSRFNHPLSGPLQKE